MKQSTKRLVSMIVGLLFLLGAAIVYFNFMVPAYDGAQTLKSKTLSLDRFLTTEQETVNKVKDLIANYKGEGQVQDAVSAALPASEDAVGALAQLYGLAQNSGLSLQTVSLVNASLSSAPGAASAPKGTSILKPLGTSVFQLKLSGSYESLKAFLERLETNMRIFDVQTLVVQPVVVAPGRFSPLMYSYDLSVATYYQAP